MKTLAEKIEVMQAALRGEPIEVQYNPGENWRVCGIPIFSWGQHDYRIAVTQDSFDWAHVSPIFTRYARDSTGNSYFYSGRPYQGKTMWTPSGCLQVNANLLSSLKVGTCDWRDSLQERPK